MPKCVPDCLQENCHLCAYLEKLCQINAKQRIRQFEIDRVENWSTEDVVQALKNRKVRQYEISKEIEFLEAEYFKRQDPTE